jgi:hypothetical protein
VSGYALTPVRLDITRENPQWELAHCLYYYYFGFQSYRVEYKFHFVPKAKLSIQLTGF